MGYDVKVLADSISPEGCRLTTMEVTFPRPYLAEMNTHTLFSRNSASSRAIPPEKLIERVKEEPYVPETFNARVKGMGVGEAFDPDRQKTCRTLWLSACREAWQVAMALNRQGVDKSRVNRLLEPFMWHTAIITATEWDNFFALRQPMEGEVPSTDHGAQPEMQIIARMMRDAREASTPRPIARGHWGHLPLVVRSDLDDIARSPYSEAPLYSPMVSGGRCARVSFDTHGQFEPHGDSYERSKRLQGSGHWSPFQHPARPFTSEEWELVGRQQSLIREFCEYTRQSDGREGIPPEVEAEMVRRAEFCGNYRGFVQLRKLFDHEFDYSETLKAVVR